MFVGVMSGTSMDAVDLACVEFEQDRPTLRAASNAAWPKTLLREVRAFADGECLNAAAFARLDAAVGRFLGDTINIFLADAAIAPESIRAIGCHGQTVGHEPDGDPGATLQLGDANVIAEVTGITTVNDFRRRDLAAGGQGAPLAPAFHAAALGAEHETRVVLNLGGIANITLLPADGAPGPGFDTGPANCLMDTWSQRHTGKAFDAGGAWAASGRVDQRLLTSMLADPYFALPPPKSTGTQYFSAAWLDRLLSGGPQAAPADVQATLLALTSRSIADAIAAHAADVARVLVCGGGVHNTGLLTALGEDLGCPLEPTTRYGIDPDWMEAIAFAWLARRTLAGMPGNLPAVTGAAGERILGAIHPA